jgi:hypothetical protein
LTIQTVRDAYYNPLPPDQMAHLSKEQQQAAQRNALDRIGQQYKIEPDALEDYVKSAESGLRAPDVPLSNTQLEDLIGKWVSPDNARGPDGLVDPFLANEIRKREIAAVAQSVGADPEDIEARIRLRISRADQPESLRSLERAYTVVNDVSDSPAFLGVNGENLVENPQDAAVLKAEMTKYTGKAVVPKLIRQLRDAEKRANAAKQIQLWNSDNYEDYRRWFGDGRAMSDDAYEKYRSGALPRYKDNPDPATADDRDRVIKLVGMLPPTDPTRRKLVRSAVKYRRLSTKEWKSILEYDEISRRALALEDLDGEAE